MQQGIDNIAVVMGQVNKTINSSKEWDIRQARIETANKVAEELIEILNEHVRKAGQGNFYIRSKVMAYDNDKYETRVSIFFDHDGATHESWYQEGYPDGVDLIILLNNGYHADGRVWKYDHEWGGHKFYSRQDYEGAHFVQSAVAEFNSAHVGDAVAEYDRELYR